MKIKNNHWFDDKKYQYIRYLIEPFIIGFHLQNLRKTFMWIICILIGGLAGVVVDILRNYRTMGMSCLMTLEKECQMGVFYTFTLVVIPSIFLSLKELSSKFKNGQKSQNLLFDQVLPIFIGLLGLVWLFCFVFYVVDAEVDFGRSYMPQYAFLCLVVFFLIYNHGLLLMMDKKDDMTFSPDVYISTENKEVKELDMMISFREPNNNTVVSINNYKVEI